jgi:hypothetical protein
MVKPRALVFFTCVLLAICGTTSGGWASDASDPQFGPHAVPLEAREFHLGSMRLLSLHDEEMLVANDGKTFGANVSPQEVAALLRSKSVKEDRIPVSINVLYAERDDRRYLFDTGMAPAAKGNLLDNLTAPLLSG